MQEGKQRIVLTDRKRLEADGVKNVIAFDEGYLELETELGILSISGEGMRVESLNQENGKIAVIGIICEIGYKEKKARKKGFGL